MVADDDGNGCPRGVPGTVYMRMSLPDFSYKGDPAKTAANRLRGFFTVGDVGYLDDEGFLFLCARVADVAVFGIPDADWGEKVMAVVQPASGESPGPELAAAILASLDGRLARMKWPTVIDFIGEMPRDPSGKLLKRRLRDPYWQGHDRAI